MSERKYSYTFPILAVSFALLICSCEKKEPVFIPRQALGKDTGMHFDTMQDQPKFIKVKKKDANTKEAVARRRELKDKVKGRTKAYEPWEY